jgi:hypothetical protein
MKVPDRSLWLTDSFEGGAKGTGVGVWTGIFQLGKLDEDR